MAQPPYFFPDVNVSHAVVDWNALTEALGADRVLGFKVGNGDVGPADGGPMSDSAFRAHYQGCKDHDIIGIGYWFGPLQVDRFLLEFPPREGFIPVFDCEGSHVDAGDIDLIESFLTKVDAEWGAPCWFYGRRKWLDAGAPAGTAAEDRPWWGSRYNDFIEDSISGLGTLTVWQYKGGDLTDPRPAGWPTDFPGVANGSCDMNVLIPTFEEVFAVPHPADDLTVEDVMALQALAAKLGPLDDVIQGTAEGAQAFNRGEAFDVAWGIYKRAGYLAAELTDRGPPPGRRDPPSP